MVSFGSCQNSAADKLGARARNASQPKLGDAAMASSGAQRAADRIAAATVYFCILVVRGIRVIVC